uniref:ornithine decarboxylase n=1 Tax=Glossina palpalis gambiensis TaxID=67801 RepID=A0A1B0BUW0_9MUSC
MFKESEINYYSDELNLRRIINSVDLQDVDEALNICDISKIEQKLQIWQKYMPRVKPFYALKCNEDPLIVKTLADLGTGFDCASKSEIKQILNSGVQPERIIFANPCKPASHIEYAKENQVRCSTVDSEFEIYKLHKHYPESHLVIRFRYDAKDAQIAFGDKFGCDPEHEAPALMLLAKSLQLNVIGTSFHVGTGCNDLPAYERAIRISKKLFTFGSLIGFNMRLLDIGGGFPGDDDEKFKNIADIVNSSLKLHFPNDDVNIIAEPGRFFVAAAYTLICKIYAKREIRSPLNNKLLTKMYYLNDGMYGSFNGIFYEHQQITVQHFLEENEENKLPRFKTILWGPTCDSLDKIIEDLDLPDLQCDDVLAFPNMGAYSVTLARPFNGFLSPRILYFRKIHSSS